jgi:hypothetical protein
MPEITELSKASAQNLDLGQKTTHTTSTAMTKPGF